MGIARLIYNSGAGANSLVLQSGSARIDSTAAGGTLNSTIQTGAQLSTNQLNQNGLTLADAAPSDAVAWRGDEQGHEPESWDRVRVGHHATMRWWWITRADRRWRASAHSILSGRGGSGLGKLWNGAGITSSTAAQANTTAPDSRSVGYAENALLPLGPNSDFRGQAVDLTSVLIAYTRTADANLDGVVNNDDVTVVGANFAPGAAKPAWALGDFEYNGSVDNDDVTLLGVFYQPAIRRRRRFRRLRHSRLCWPPIPRQSRGLSRIPRMPLLACPARCRRLLWHGLPTVSRPRPKVSSPRGQRRPSVLCMCGVRRRLRGRTTGRGRCPG